jgi:hypothetical protein
MPNASNPSISLITILNNYSYLSGTLYNSVTALSWLRNPGNIQLTLNSLSFK